VIAVSELKRWLDTLEFDDFVGIDETGLTLRSVEDEDAYLEIGGLLEDENDGI